MVILGFWIGRELLAVCFIDLEGAGIGLTQCLFNTPQCNGSALKLKSVLTLVKQV